MSDNALERLRFAHENNPNADAKRLLWLADVDPSHLEAAEAIVADEDVDDTDQGAVHGRRPVVSADPEVDWNHWADADFSTPASNTWPDELLEREQWMGHAEKKPFAPWSIRDPPVECRNDDCPAERADDDACDCDGRFKWGYRGHYADGETVAMAEIDPRLDGRAFIQREDDPYVYVDGDDVRDPETGDVHPAFVAILEHLGATYCDISQSGTGVHAIYRGDLEELDLKQASWRLDEDPWGSIEDDLPSIEIYPGKRVCVATGEHVPGTPAEVREWNADALEPICEATNQFGQGGRDRDEDDVSFDRDDYDLEDYEPTTTSSSETTDEIRDVFAAIDRLDAQRVAEKTIVQRWNDSASTSGGERAFWPTWGSLNDGGTANICNDERWQDTGELGGYGGVVTMAAIDADEIQPANARPVDGETWWRGVEHLRELGFDIPEYDPSTDDDDVEHVAVLPHSPRARAASSGWDWRHAGSQDNYDEDPLQEARDRTTEKIASKLGGGDRTLLEALPTLGKTYGTIKAAAETGEPVTVLTTRGNKEQYDQIEAICEEHDLTYKRLPAFTRHCETARGDHGEDWKRTVMDWYNRGATPKEIHALAEGHHGEDLPCQHDGECNLAVAWDFDPDEHPETEEPWDVLIGHYTHGYKDKVTNGRSVVFDEFPEGAFQHELGHGLEGAITYYLQQHDDIPYEDHTDLHENRSDQQRRADAIAFLQEYGLDSDATAVLADRAGHANAPAAVFTILAGEDIGNGWRRAQFPDDDRIGLYDRESGSVSILAPPDLYYTSAVIGLDGTPTRRLWQVVLGERRLNHTQVLTDEERKEYVQDALNLQVVKTTDAVKSYSPKESEIRNRVSLAEDRALLEKINENHDEQPSLITTNRAESLYEDEGLLELVDDHQHHGNVLGSNEFDDKRLGSVIGSRNFGPRYVTKWAAYLDEDVDPTFPSPENDFEPTDYGYVGNEIRTHMREHETLQAVMRFGRDGNGAVVYVHTDTLPDWLPLAGEGRVLKTWSDGMRQVIDVATDLEEWTTTEIANHPDVEISERQVRTHLSKLYDRGVLEREFDGTGYIWQDTGLHRIGEHGDVELEPVDVDELSDDTSAEVARSSNYRWNFRTFASTKRSSATRSPAAGDTPSSAAVNQGGPPLHDSG